MADPEAEAVALLLGAAGLPGHEGAVLLVALLQIQLQGRHLSVGDPGQPPTPCR